MATNEADNLTTIPIRKGTRDRLKKMGGKGETYDTLLNRLMDVATATPPFPTPPQASKKPLVDFEPVE